MFEEECDGDSWGGWRAVVVVELLVCLVCTGRLRDCCWPGSSVFAIGKFAREDGDEG